MAENNDTRLLLELVKQIKESQSDAVGNLRISIEGLSEKISSNENKMNDRDEKLLMKIESTGNLSAQLKTEHMDIKNTVEKLDKDVKALMRLRTYMLGVVGACSAILAVFGQDIVDVIKKMVYFISGNFDGDKNGKV